MLAFSLLMCSEILGLFFVFAACYFAVNTVTVNAAVAIKLGSAVS